MKSAAYKLSETLGERLHRYGEQGKQLATNMDIQINRDQCSRSFFKLLPDGSIAIEDGYGSGIYMSGGNIRVDEQGNVRRVTVRRTPDERMGRVLLGSTLGALAGAVPA